MTALSTEKSGSDEFEFEYGAAFAEHIEAFRPTFAKVLVRYNPEGDAALNQRQTARLKQLSDYCRAAEQRFMFELLVPATKAQMNRAEGTKQTYDQLIRPAMMLQTIHTLQDAGVEPDIWKIEGLDRREDCERIVETARRDGRTNVGCIVLGRGADEAKVVHWLTIAASVPGSLGSRSDDDVLGRDSRLPGAHNNARRGASPGSAALPRVGDDLRAGASVRHVMFVACPPNRRLPHQRRPRKPSRRMGW